MKIKLRYFNFYLTDDRSKANVDSDTEEPIVLTLASFVAPEDLIYFKHTSKTGELQTLDGLYFCGDYENIPS